MTTLGSIVTFLSEKESFNENRSEFNFHPWIVDELRRKDVLGLRPSVRPIRATPFFSIRFINRFFAKTSPVIRFVSKQLRPASIKVSLWNLLSSSRRWRIANWIHNFFLSFHFPLRLIIVFHVHAPTRDPKVQNWRNCFMRHRTEDGKTFNSSKKSSRQLKLKNSHFVSRKWCDETLEVKLVAGMEKINSNLLHLTGEEEKCSSNCRNLL